MEKNLLLSPSLSHHRTPGCRLVWVHVHAPLTTCLCNAPLLLINDLISIGFLLRLTVRGCHGCCVRMQMFRSLIFFLMLPGDGGIIKHALWSFCRLLVSLSSAPLTASVSPHLCLLFCLFSHHRRLNFILFQNLYLLAALLFLILYIRTINGEIKSC